MAERSGSREQDAPADARRPSDRKAGCRALLSNPLRQKWRKKNSKKKKKDWSRKTQEKGRRGLEGRTSSEWDGGSMRRLEERL